MKRLMMFIMIVLAITSIIGVHAYTFETTDYVSRGGPARITGYDPRINWGGPIEAGRINTWAYLEPYEFDKGKGVGRGGYDPIYPRGTARVQSSVYYGYPKGSVRIDVKDVPGTDEVNGVYEAWLVDEDSGYRLSLGSMIALRGGVIQHTQVVDAYFDAYDTIEITLEPLDDIDPTPGPIVLIGNIPRSHTFYDPEPKQGIMLTRNIKNY